MLTSKPEKDIQKEQDSDVESYLQKAVRFEKRTEELKTENEKLKQELQVMRKALAEIETQELTIAHQFLSTSINIKSLLQDSYSKLQV